MRSHARKVQVQRRAQHGRHSLHNRCCGANPSKLARVGRRLGRHRPKATRGQRPRCLGDPAGAEQKLHARDGELGITQETALVRGAEDIREVSQ